MQVRIDHYQENMESLAAFKGTDSTWLTVEGDNAGGFDMVELTISQIGEIPDRTITVPRRQLMKALEAFG